VRPGLTASQRFGGGPLATVIGDTLTAQGCWLRSCCGCTEGGFLTDGPVRGIAAEDWAWCRFDPSIDVRWRPAGDGAHELEILRGEKHIVSVENLDDVRGYATRDLWVPHPTKEGLWKMCVDAFGVDRARADEGAAWAASTT
jgi:hypothetical protein